MASFKENGALAPDDTVNTAADGVATPTNAFEALGLDPDLLQAVEALGYTAPTEVQRRTIPLALAPRADGFNDLLVNSQTGSGKTAAFLLPVLQTLLVARRAAAAVEKAAWDAKVAKALAQGLPAPKKPRRHSPLNYRHFKPAVPGALILCPTRELAQQVARDAIELVRFCQGLRIAVVAGGMPYQQQVAQLQNASLIVATPGRLLDLQQNGKVVLDQVHFLVVDEADRMLDLGFADALAEVNQLTAQRQQTMMFSATFAGPIQQLAMRMMHDGGARVQKIQIASPQQSHANIRQELYWADNAEHRRALLDHWLRDHSIDQAIVFACTQIECDQLASDLQQSGFAAIALHGALSQALRNRRLKALRDGKVQILVATDVAARGIDVPTITHVINFGLPMKAEDYTHRIGRTGRAGRDGLAITLAEFRERKRLAAIEAYTRQPFTSRVVEGLEPKRHYLPLAEKYGARKLDRGRSSADSRSGKGGSGGGFARGGNRSRSPQVFSIAEQAEGRSDRQGARGRVRFESAESNASWSASRTPSFVKSRAEGRSVAAGARPAPRSGAARAKPYKTSR